LYELAVDQQDLRTAHRKQPRIIPRSESLRDSSMKPPRRQGIVIAIVRQCRDRGDADVRRAVVEAVEAEGEAVGRGEIANMRVYQAR
jgi:hypothetical protein